MKTPQLLTDEGIDKANSGDLEGALKCFKAVAELEPHVHSSWFNMGIIYQRLNNIEKAIYSYRKVVELFPYHVDATRSIGELYFNSRNYGKAKFWFERLFSFGVKESKAMMAYNICLQANEDSKTVFISYPWKLKSQVKYRIITVLKENQIDYFFDEERIPDARNTVLDSLPDHIELGIAECSVIIYMWSQYTPSSYYMNMELCTAIGMMKKVIIVLCDDTPLPPILDEMIRKNKVNVYHINNDSHINNILYELYENDNSFLEVIEENKNSPTIETYLSDNIKFEWIKLNGGILPDFCVGKYPVTQAQWEFVMGNNPSRFKGDLSRPVETVSWYDVQDFINRMNTIDGKTYRLLTDIEWEYACRAGSNSRWCFGADELELHNYAWYIDNTGHSSIGDSGIRRGLLSIGGSNRVVEVEFSPYYTNSVMSKKPNSWGIYHVHGNVWEWCLDDALTSGLYDTMSWEGQKSVRGGSFKEGPITLNFSTRVSQPPDNRADNIGFRLCMELPQP